MKGKIFKESDNLYADQAKVLFDYYQQAAERIVQEEERIEKEIAILEAEKEMLNQQLSKAKLWKWILCILIIPFFIFWHKENGLIKKIKAIEVKINEFILQHTEIFRDYKVNKLGIAYVPVAEQVKYENKSFMVDYTGMVPESNVKLQLSKQNELLVETISDLEKLSAEAPIVEGSNEIEKIETEQYSRSMQQLNQHDYLGKLERSLRAISFCMDDLDVTSVSLPLVANNSTYLDFLKEYSTGEVPEGVPVFEVFDEEKYQEDIARFQELNKLKDSLSRHTAQFEDVLKDLMVSMSQSVQAISALKVASTNKLVVESNKVLYKILKSPYNHYSPALEAAEIERIRNENFNYGENILDYVPFQLKDSSRTRYNLFSDAWTAEDGSTTNFPFGVHQIYEEIVAPVVQNLMNETRIERLKIYNHIKDQKISYLNQWHQDTEDFYGRNRAESADLINLMRASLRDYIAAENTLMSLEGTEKSMIEGGSLDGAVVTSVKNQAEVYTAFSSQSQEFKNVQEDFDNYMTRLKGDIDRKAEEFGHIEYYDASLRDGNAHDTAVATSEIHELDERRKPLVTVNPLFAKVSEMPPPPSVENITYEHISLNLPVIAKNSLLELERDLMEETEKEEPVEEQEEQNTGYEETGEEGMADDQPGEEGASHEETQEPGEDEAMEDMPEEADEEYSGEDENEDESGDYDDVKEDIPEEPYEDETTGESGDEDQTCEEETGNTDEDAGSEAPDEEQPDSEKHPNE